MRAFALLGAVLVWLGWGPAPRAHACTCVKAVEATRGLAGWVAVFEGTVLSVQDQGDSLLVTFDVAQAWKGVEETSFEVATGYDADDCGYPFEVGESYLVFAGPFYDDESRPRVTWCTGVTRSESEAAQRLRDQLDAPVATDDEDGDAFEAAELSQTQEAIDGVHGAAPGPKPPKPGDEKPKKGGRCSVSAPSAPHEGGLSLVWAGSLLAAAVLRRRLRPGVPTP